jgi:hypothetical protein
MEVDWDENLITWIKKFNASFPMFGTACQINYKRTMNGEYVWDSDSISVDTHRSFYKSNQYNGHGSVNGLRVMPAIINKIVRFTLYPKSGKF